ncbi:MAG: phage tail protein [Coprobacillus sp.]|nr:phage tail protein [Coprobacillus sp.]
MGKIGNFGSAITFETSDARILNFTSFKRSLSGRWTEHQREGKKPQLQFMGPDSAEVTFTIVLDAEHGVSPRSTIDKIEKCVTRGTPNKLVIGNSKVGSNKFVMTNLSEAWDRVFDKGELVRATLDVTLREYA